MARALLLTQCLQNDFAAVLGPDQAVPNRLHVGPSEARRLLGYEPRSGPVAQMLAWARAQSADDLAIVHIRDWHDPDDPAQRDHLRTFGDHCLRDTEGARLVLDLESDLRPNERIVEASGLNDFERTRLPEVLAEVLGSTSPPHPLFPQEEPMVGRAEALADCRVAVVGVWTDAKVSFLLYDLKTRLGIDHLATCSALTASSSRTQHFNALEQLRRLLGVHCFDSVGELAQWLVPEAGAPRLSSVAATSRPKIGFAASAEAAEPISEVDHDILACLYRDSARLELEPLGGGFSGARVLRVASWDSLGHVQAQSVAKLGPRALVATERASFERVEDVLGNDAPSVRGFVDLGERAGLKYSYAAMGQGRVRTLKRLFEDGVSEESLIRVLSAALEDVLGRFYAVAQLERLPLLEHYRFSPSFAAGVRKNVTAIVGESAAGSARLSFPGGYEVENLCAFYEHHLPAMRARPGEQRYVSFVHGDLNGANVLLDARDNVWLIDFFHTARAHVLKDLAKLENDVLYLFTPLRDEDELAAALSITRALRAVTELGDALPESLEGISAPALARAWRVVRWLRALGGRLVHEDRDPEQLSVALLRYAAHTLSFDEASPLQRRWALASACGHAEDVTRARG
ncbi:MAG: isochorismatase family protein [Deltaproteobacteria bacterium]|nr:isochorismatase family protein [Deltaproteobacteria bacterium]